MTPRRPLGAYVGGVAAVWLMRQAEPRISGAIRHYRESGQPDVARALRDTYADLCAAAEQHWAALDAEAATAAGNSVTPSEDVEPRLVSAVDCRTAAAALDVSERRVRQLLASGLLAGRKVGGRWLADPQDVARYARDRKDAA